MELLVTQPETARRLPAKALVLAHGAGAPMDSDWMEAVTERVVEHGLPVVRFEFEYMARRRDDPTRKPPPDRAPKLLARYHAVLDQLRSERRWNADRLLIGGKSMGGRIASMIADEAGVAGLVCLGYPFHPPGKPESTRTEHLAEMSTRALILQGERDSFGTVADVANYDLSPSIQIEWLEDGNHDLKPRVRSGHTLDENLDDAVERLFRWLRG